MRRLRFSIGSLIGFILICGVGIAALKESSDLWERGTFTAMVLVLLTSVLLAAHRGGQRRAFWVGFALFGGVYLGMSMVPAVESRLVCSQGLAYLHSKIPGQSQQNWTVTFTSAAPGVANSLPQALAFSPNGTSLGVQGQGSVRVWNVGSGKLMTGWGGSQENFVKIGHTLIALVLAWSGGMLSRRLGRPASTIDGSVHEPAPDSPASEL